MRTALAGLIVILMSATTASAVQVEFLGFFCPTNATLSQACIDAGMVRGDCSALRYSPPNVGTNGPSTRFSIYEQHWAENYTLASGSLSTLKTVQGTGIARGVFTFTSQMTNVTVPALPTATTKSISMTGNIFDFDGAAGCDITFRGSVTLRPPN